MKNKWVLIGIVCIFGLSILMAVDHLAIPQPLPSPDPMDEYNRKMQQTVKEADFKLLMCYSNEMERGYIMQSNMLIDMSNSLFNANGK